MSRIAGAVVVAVLALSGCGGDSGDTGDGAAADKATPSEVAEEPTPDAGDTEGTAGDPPDLCTLFTAEDFQSVTGEAAGGPPEEGLVAGAMRGGCTYSGEAGFPMVMISAYDAKDREATLAMVDSEPVDGLGAEADWAPQTGLLISIEGVDWYLQVLATGDGAGFDQEASVEAAKIVLDNL